MKNGWNRITLFILQNTTIILFVAVFVVFGLMLERFRSPVTLLNILVQSSAVGIVAIGMTFVLLTAGIDLSVGSIMFLSVIVGGSAINKGAPIAVGFLIAVAAGAAFGAVNAFCITWLRIIPFVVTLATLYIGRGIGLWVTQTKSLPLPSLIREIGVAEIHTAPTTGAEGLSTVTTIPLIPIAIFLLVLVAAHVVLRRTPFGRQVYAVGNDAEIAKKAGINVRRVLFFTYVISGVCAALGGVVSVALVPDVAPSFGWQYEFFAIAAAVLGGTSLFGGHGNVFPGTVIGAILFRTVEAGLQMLNSDPYFYPLIIASVIFFAVFIDSLRHGRLQKLKRRKIRAERLA